MKRGPWQEAERAFAEQVSGVVRPIFRGIGVGGHGPLKTCFIGVVLACSASAALRLADATEPRQDHSGCDRTRHDSAAAVEGGATSASFAARKSACSATTRPDRHGHEHQG